MAFLFADIGMQCANRCGTVPWLRFSFSESHLNPYRVEARQIGTTQNSAYEGRQTIAQPWYAQCHWWKIPVVQTHVWSYR